MVSAMIAKKGRHIRFIVCQLVMLRNNPAERAAIPCALNTVKSLYAWALYFSSDL